VNRNELAELSKMLAATMELYDRQIGESAVFIWVSTLEKFSLDDIRAALTAHIQHPERGRFAPKPADVIAAMQDRIRIHWQSADEAWAAALQASDERVTVVWSEAAAKAYADCQPIMASGDSIGARMAFKASYEREMQQAIRELRTPQHTVSLGHDPVQRVEAVELAVQRGALQHAHGERLLLGARKEAGEAPQAFARLAGKVEQPGSRDTVKQHLVGLMEKIEGATSVVDIANARLEKARQHEASVKSGVKQLMGGAA